MNDTPFDRTRAAAPFPPRAIRAGRLLSVACVLVLLASATAKLAMPPESAKEAEQTLGFSLRALPGLAVLELICTALYAIPSTAPLGAVLLTGYLGGAVATHVRVGDAAFLFPLALGATAWLGLYLREERLRPLAPLRRRTANVP